jgi:hypothetical protein
MGQVVVVRAVSVRTDELVAGMRVADGSAVLTVLSVSVPMGNQSVRRVVLSGGNVAYLPPVSTWEVLS